MLLSLRYNLARLAVFSGRESVGRFWPYAAAMIALLFVGLGAIMLPLLGESFARMQQFAATHPDQATVTSGPGSYSISGYHPELFPDLSDFIRASGMGMTIFVLLVAAAVARRLHDRARSGLWGLLPLPFLSFGLIGLGRVFAPAQFNFGLFAAIFLNNVAYLGCVLFLIVQLASPGTCGPNPYGDSADA